LWQKKGLKSSKKKRALGLTKNMNISETLLNTLDIVLACSNLNSAAAKEMSKK
jgi:hypothetical protein